MNAEKLHVIAKAIHDEIRTSNTVALLQQLVSHLQNQINQPQQTQHQQNVANTYNALLKVLTDAPSENFSPAWRQITEEIGASHVLGHNLRLKLEDIFESNKITPALAVNQITPIQNTAQQIYTALDQLLNGFNVLGIGSDSLNPGECEIGVLIPREYVKNNLEDFSKELKELHSIFNIYSEIVSGESHKFTLRAISSSDLSVFMQFDPKVAECIAVTVASIVATYKGMLEIKKLKRELKEQGVPDQNLEGIEDYANTQIENTVERISKEVIKGYYKGDDSGRKRELGVALRISLKKIARRIDRGFNLEIRIEPLQNESKEENGAPVADQEDINSSAEIINSSSSILQFIKQGGEPLLSLPEEPEADQTGDE